MPVILCCQLPCLLALGAEHQQWWWGAEGAERSKIDEVGFWWKLSWEAVWVREAGKGGPVVLLVMVGVHGRSQPGLGDDVVIFF